MQIQKISPGKVVLLSALVFLIAFTSLSQENVSASDEDDAREQEEDMIKKFGLSALILFFMGFPYIILFQIMKLYMKLPKDSEKVQASKKKYFKFFKVVRKPLLYLHYGAGSIAIALLLYHGINFTFKDEEKGTVGWITAGILLFYVISGALLKLKLQPLKNQKQLKKILGTVHRSLILILVAFALHIVHIE